MDLYLALLVTAGDGADLHQKNWAKYVYMVNPELPGGYMYVGDFVRTGSIEVEIQPTVFIVYSTPAAGEPAIYRAVVMDADGELRRTDVWTDDSRPGWALRIREGMITLLARAEMDADLRAAAPTPTTIPRETLAFLRSEALTAMETGDDVLVYPDILLTLVEYYEETVLGR